MKTFLFSLGLIPVQEWIEQARRSRDLRAGSVLLAYVMAKVLAAIEGRPGGFVLLPLAPKSSGPTPASASNERPRFAALARQTFAEMLTEVYGIPNRASGYFEAESAAAAADFLAGLEADLVRGTWQEWTERFLRPGATRPAASASADERAFWAELDPHLAAYRDATGPGGDCPLSLVWAAKEVTRRPAEKDDDGLRADLAAIDVLYSDVKRTRPIRPWPAGAPIGKCNQCGRREAVGPTADFDIWRTWQAKLPAGAGRWLTEGFRLDAGERLCYVCLARRIAGYDAVDPRTREPFPSTGEVALRPWLARIKQVEPLQRRVEALRSLLARHPAEDLASALLRRNRRPSEPQLPPEVTTQVDALFEAVHAHRDAGAEQPIPATPPSYLAMLAFDGDGMGAHVREHPTPLPERMDAFARKVERLLDRHGAATFYLAGDEGLAMAPAAAALPLAIELRALFDESLEPIAGAFTLSAGLAYFEQSSPIAGAMRSARAALRAAKQLEKKNALGVAVEAASGTRWQLAQHWGVPWKRIAAAALAVREDRLAAGWAYDVERFLAGLDTETWNHLLTRPEQIRDEVKRLLGRRLLRGDGEGDRAEPSRHDALEKAWKDLEGATWWDPERGQPQPRPQSEQFHLIGFLGRQVAGPAGEEGRT